MSNCFHCGLPVPEDLAPPRLEVEGIDQEFCCHGCHAVCKAILDAGLSDYYHHRTGTAASANQPVIPEFLSRVDLYDRPEIQKEFVVQEQDWCEASLLLENIRCPACLWLNEKHLRSLPGVIDVHIDDVTQRARVRWNPQAIQLSQILTAIADIGYIAHPYDASRSEQLQKLRRQRSTEKLIFAGMLGMLVMNFALATYFMGGQDAEGQLPLWIVIGRWTGLALTTLIMAYSGQEFFAGAWSDIRNRRLGMDIPVVFGLVAAYIGSLHATITGHGEVYYDSIAMFVFFLLLARRYELGGKLAASDQLENLARIVPGKAQRIDSNEVRQEVAVDDLIPGDLIRLVPGETAPVDGTIENGASSFDESLLSGESIPVLKQAGDSVAAGSVNGDQPVIMKVTKTIQASALNEIRLLVEHGLEQRPHYAQLAQRVASVFVAVILVIAFATATYWFQTGSSSWLSNTIAVLIVTCPCALALATPVALTVSAGRLIRMGILPLRMQAIDALAMSDHFVFDKTGTLTTGMPRLVRAIGVSDLDRNQALQISAAMSADSEHPIARVVRNAVTRKIVSTEDIQNVPGAGISASINGSEWRFGKPEFAFADGLLDPDSQTYIESCRRKGQTVSLLSSDNAVQAIFAFDDPVRTGVKEMLDGLTESGVSHFSILSGDSHKAVASIGGLVGITDSHGSQTPADKLAWIRSKQQTGRRIAMFGDGINDAPALAAADVSISFSEATDLANVSSDFLILGKDASVLADARDLAIATRRNIKQNFGWAIGYNLIAVPFAVMGLIPPWGAAIGMSLSSLIVVTNALRLQSPRHSKAENPGAGNSEMINQAG